MNPTSLSPTTAGALDERLRDANEAFAQRYPGDGGRRQPVHTVYGGAHIFRAGSAGRLGEIALRFLDEYAPDPLTFANAVGLPGSDRLPGSGDEAEELGRRMASDPEGLRGDRWEAWLAATVYERIREKLEREPVEDFRIDFEDGYGNRPDEEEDATAVSSARETARGMEEGTLPPFLGIRIKPFSRELTGRALRTLDFYLTALTEETGGRLPDNFVVTLPKVVMPEQVAALAEAFRALERELGLEPGSLEMELMVETPQSILGPDGRCPLPDLVEAAEGRCVAAHFGVYDYTASLSITAEYQTMDHPVCDAARRWMQIALAGTGVWLSDGATNVLPVPVHRAGEGETLTPDQEEENREGVHRGWRLHFRDVRHSLESGYYQGWDLHPAQLATRYAAFYSFFLQGLESASHRLRSFVEQAAGQASLHGDVMDDAATGQGLLNFFLRGLASGAISREEALETGLTLEELRSRSFLAIVEGRRQHG